MKIAATHLVLVSVLGCQSNSTNIDADGTDINICDDNSWCSSDNSKVISIADVFFGKAEKLDQEVHDFGNDEITKSLAVSRPITVMISNEEQGSVWLKKIEVSLSAMQEVKNCQGGAGGYKVVTHYKVRLKNDMDIPATLAVEHPSFKIAGNEIEGFNIFIGREEAWAGSYPWLYRLRIILHDHKGNKVVSKPLVIATTESLVEEAIAHQRTAQDANSVFWYTGENELDLRNEALECFAEEGRRIENFAKGAMDVSPGVEKMIDEFKDPTYFSFE
ncbi:hypothetical protein [Streptomyces sp. bgisy034]|uniref:hypothetical protein n=1 Tax=Streptomyces sp. bgisy034 TaxID=3413774 RepID=UPI003EB6E6F4